jgi:hypothetical protein
MQRSVQVNPARRGAFRTYMEREDDEEGKRTALVG